MVFIIQVFSYCFWMLCIDSSRLCMSGLSLCDLCLCCSTFGSRFSNKYLLTYLLTYWPWRSSVDVCHWWMPDVWGTTNVWRNIVSRSLQPSSTSVGNNLARKCCTISYFRSLLQLMNIFRHVRNNFGQVFTHWNNIISDGLSECWNYFEIILFYML